MSASSVPASIVVVKRPRGGLFAAVRSVPVWLRSLARGESLGPAKRELAASPATAVPTTAPEPPAVELPAQREGGEPASSPDQVLLRAGLGERGAVVFERPDGVLVAELPAQAAGALLRWLRDEPALGFDVLYDLTVIDRLPESPRFEVVYGLRSSVTHAVLRVRARIEVDPPQIVSVASFWRSADWLEREAHDLFGVRFVGHPGLHPLLLPPDFEGAPLRRDFEPEARAGEGAGA